MSLEDVEVTKLLSSIDQSLKTLVERAPPKFRSWGWRLMLWLSLLSTLGGAVAGAIANWFLRDKIPPHL